MQTPEEFPMAMIAINLGEIGDAAQRRDKFVQLSAFWHGGYPSERNASQAHAMYVGCATWDAFLVARDFCYATSIVEAPERVPLERVLDVVNATEFRDDGDVQAIRHLLHSEMDEGRAAAFLMDHIHLTPVGLSAALNSFLSTATHLMSMSTSFKYDKPIAQFADHMDDHDCGWHCKFRTAILAVMTPTAP